MNLRDIVNNDDRKNLPYEERFKVLERAAPDVASLPSEERGRLIGRLQEAGPVNPPEEGFWSSVGSGLKDLAVGIPGFVSSAAEVMANPAKGMGKLFMETIPRSVEQANSIGKSMDVSPTLGTIEGAGRVASGMFPLTEKAGEQFGRGNIAGGLGTTAVAVGSMLLPGAAIRGAKEIAPKLRPSFDAITPERAAAVQYADEQGIPVSFADRTGNRGFQGVKKLQENLPGTAGRTQSLEMQATGQIKGNIGEISKTQSPVEGAIDQGNSVINSATGMIERTKSSANKSWETLKSISDEPKYTKQIQTGTKEITSKTLDSSGNTIIQQIPVYEKVQSPIDFSGLVDNLTPIYEELKASPGVTREWSPAFGTIEDIVQGKTIQPLRVALNVISTLKSLGRGGQASIDNPLVVTKSQGLAKEAIPILQREIEKTVGGMGNEALNAWKEGNRLWALQEDAAFNLESLTKIKAEPAAILKTLTQSGDLKNNFLGQVIKFAPETRKVIARSLLDGIVDNATDASGNFSLAKASTSWNKLGSETKMTLFPKNVPELNNLFSLAKIKTETPNASGTGSMVGLIKMLGSGGLMGFAYGQPMATASTAGVLALSRLYLEASYSPKIANLLKMAGRVDANTRIGAQIIGQLKTELDKSQKSDNANLGESNAPTTGIESSGPAILPQGSTGGGRPPISQNLGRESQGAGRGTQVGEPSGPPSNLTGAAASTELRKFIIDKKGNAKVATGTFGPEDTVLDQNGKVIQRGSVSGAALQVGQFRMSIKKGKKSIKKFLIEEKDVKNLNKMPENPLQMQDSGSTMIGNQSVAGGSYVGQQRGTGSNPIHGEQNPSGQAKGTGNQPEVSGKTTGQANSEAISQSALDHAKRLADLYGGKNKLPTKERTIITYDEQSGKGYRVWEGENVKDIPILKNLPFSQQRIQTALNNQKGEVWDALLNECKRHYIADIEYSKYIETVPENIRDSAFVDEVLHKYWPDIEKIKKEINSKINPDTPDVPIDEIPF